MQAAQTYHIDGVNVGKLRKELTTAEGELGIGLEELLSVEKKKRHYDDISSNLAEELRVGDIVAQR